MTTRQQLLSQTLSQSRYQDSIYQNGPIKQSGEAQHVVKPSNSLLTSSERPDFSVTALIFYYRRIFAAFLVLPAFLFIIPGITVVSFAILSYLSQGRPITVLFFTITFTTYTRSQIVRFAPTEELAKRALKSSSLALPMLCIIAASGIFRFFVFIGLTATKPGISFESFIGACRLGMHLGTLAFIMNASILIRFLGPISVVKCSNAPLQNNPIDSMVARFTSIETIQALLEAITSPSKQTAFSKQKSIAPGYFKKPIQLHCILQLLCHAFIGFISGSLLFIRGNLICITAAICCMVNVITCVLVDDGHEIDTHHYPSFLENVSILEMFKWLQSETIKSMKTENKFQQIIVSLFLSFLLQPDKNRLLGSLGSSLALQIVSALVFSILVSYLCSAFLYFSDALHRLFLSQPMKSTNALFPNIKMKSYSSKNVFMTQFLIRTTLQNTPVTKDILSYSPPLSGAPESLHSANAFSLLQENHFNHIKELTGRMARFLQLTPYIHLAEEILRLNLLVNFTLPSYSSDTSQEEMMFHFTCIIKALCVYIGGFGEAIAKPAGTLYQTDDVTFEKSTKIQEKEIHLSSSAILQAEYVVYSIQRILSKSSKLKKNSFYFSHLHLYVPSLLHSLHLLYKGLIAYGSSKMNSEMTSGKLVPGVGTGGHGQAADLNRFIAIRHPQVKKALEACRNVAKMIASGEKGIEDWRQSRLLSNECIMWVNTSLES